MTHTQPPSVLDQTHNEDYTVFMKRLKSLWHKITQPAVTDNIAYNAWLWNRYPKRWATGEVHRDSNDSLDFLGDEWGNKQAVKEVIDEFYLPYIKGRTLEIGCGGGRIANLTAPHVSELHCADIAENMLATAKQHLKHHNITFHLIDGASIPDFQYDAIYSFDVFVHVDIHTMWKYLQEAQKKLVTNGYFVLHTSNLLTQKGFEQFASQKKYGVKGHYFVTPEIMRRLADKAGFAIVKESQENPNNFYLARDYVVVLKKITTSSN